jgi:hypothetical protein
MARNANGEADIGGRSNENRAVLRNANFGNVQLIVN